MDNKKLFFAQNRSSYPPTTSLWQKIDMSDSGQYQLAAKYPGLYLSTNYGATWNPVGDQINYIDVSVSDTGQYMIAASVGTYLRLSTDYGATWGSVYNSGLWICCSIKGTGQYVLAGLNSITYLYQSSNYAASFNQRGSITKTFFDFSIDATGQYQYAAPGYNSYIYKSSNYGVSWANTSSLYREWYSVAVSRDNGYVIAYETNYRKTYLSSNGGTSWTEITGITTPASLSSDLSISSDGQYQSVINTGGIFTSSDYGATWTNRGNFSPNPVSIAISANGQYQTACYQLYYIVRSTDYGVTWNVVLI